MVFNHKEWYQKNREERIAYQKKYNKEHRKERSEFQKKWREENQDKHRTYTNKYRKNNPHKKSVWDKTRRGKDAIEIKGLCQICKKRKAVDRHHPNYSKPREVVLVCKQCHKDIHTRQDKTLIKPSGECDVVSRSLSSDKGTKNHTYDAKKHEARYPRY